MKTAISDSKDFQTLSPVNKLPGEQSSSRRVHLFAISSLFAIGALVYGTFIRSVGFYWDDWPVVWVYNELGSHGLTTYFTGNRPFSGWLYGKLAPFLGISPVGWQVANDVVRCLASVVLYFLFCKLWPKRKDTAWIVAAFVLLYPGFTQQAIALTYLSQNFSFLLLSTSLLLTVISLFDPRYKWILLPVSVGLGVGSYLITEYFVGLEFVRLAIVWVCISGEVSLDARRIREALLRWSPYAAAWAGYIFWRSFLFHEVHYGLIGDKNVPYLLSQALHHPVKMVGGLVVNAVHNIAMGAVYAFFRPFDAAEISPASAGSKSWVIALFIVGISLYTLRLLATSDKLGVRAEMSQERSRSIFWGGAVISVVGLIFGGLPFISGQSTFFASILSFGDRFALPFMLPACIGLACLLTWGLGRKSRTAVVALLLFAFSVFQLKSMNMYRHDWLGQKSLFWQLAWRFPDIKPGTTIFVDGLSESIGSGETPGLLDMLYQRDDRSGKLDYFMFDMRRTPDGKPAFKPSSPINRHLRSFPFMGSTSESVVTWLSPEGTLRVISPLTAAEMVNGQMLPISIAQVSRPEEITTAAVGLPDGPLLKMFGPEPKHEWSYFYQKAELERQLQHWDAVASLGDDAVKQGYAPTDASEWFPFIDGYAHAHRYRTAEELTSRVLRESPESVSALSSLWLRCSRECSPKSEELTGALSDLKTNLMLDTAQ